MEQPYPKKLSIDPIIECLFEIRFKPASGISTSDILPGILFGASRTEYPRTTRLPASQIPKDIRLQDPNLTYAPTFRMENDQFAIMIGDNVFSLSCQRPYVGWDEFKPKILSLVKVIIDSGTLSSVERFSLKYINLLEDVLEKSGLNLLDSSVSIGAFNLNEIGCNIRMEIPNNEVINIVDIVSSAKVVIQKDQSQLSGLLLNIDSIYQLSSSTTINEFKSIFDLKLDEVRENEKNIFFSLLLKETVDYYRPIYDEGAIQ